MLRCTSEKKTNDARAKSELCTIPENVILTL